MTGRAFLRALRALALLVGCCLLPHPASVTVFKPGAAPAKYRLHTYDHCPFCNRVEIFMARYNIPYERVVYGYGEGAVPDDCGGTGYNPGGGPVALTGKKMLPVLEGEGVPAPDGAKGMPESLEIIAFLIAEHGIAIPCESRRADLSKWQSGIRKLSGRLVKPREMRMPIKDWADERDIAYSMWKYGKFDYEKMEKATPGLVAQANAKLEALVPLIRGEDSVNVWGWSMDDVQLLPRLRRLACVKGLVFPEKVMAYMDATLKDTQLCDWSLSAC